MSPEVNSYPHGGTGLYDLPAGPVAIQNTPAPDRTPNLRDRPDIIARVPAAGRPVPEYGTRPYEAQAARYC